MSLWSFTYWQRVLTDFEGWHERSAESQRRAHASAERQAHVVREWCSDRVFSLSA